MIQTAVFAVSFLMNLRFKQVNDVLIIVILIFFQTSQRKSQRA